MKKTLYLASLFLGIIFSSSSAQLKNFFITTDKRTKKKCIIIGETHDKLSINQLTKIIPLSKLTNNEHKLLIELPKNLPLSKKVEKSEILAFRLFSLKSKNQKLIDFPNTVFPQIPKTKIAPTTTLLSSALEETFWKYIQNPTPVEGGGFSILQTEENAASGLLNKAFSVKKHSTATSKIILQIALKKHSPEVIYSVLSVCKTGIKSRDQRFAKQIKKALQNNNAIFPVGNLHLQGIFNHIKNDPNYCCTNITPIENLKKSDLPESLQ